MSRVPVSASVLGWAVRRSGRRRDELEHAFPHLRQWERGEGQPTLKNVEDLARQTRTPLGFFFLHQPPTERLPVPYYRTQDGSAPNGPSPDLLDTVHAMERRQAWMRQFLIEEGASPLPFVDSARITHATKAVAARIRAALGLTAGWAGCARTWSDAVRTLLEQTDKLGVLTVVNGVVGNNTHRRLDPEEFRGFVLVDTYAPLIFVNGADAKAAQMFTIAHELAHVFFGASAAFNLRAMEPANNGTELACNQVAAEFLVPEDALQEMWPTLRGVDEPWGAVARKFKVSSLVAARRALDVGLIDKAAFWSFYTAHQARSRPEPAGGGDFYATQTYRIGPRFGAAVVQAAREGRLLYSEAYALTGLAGDTFERYATTLSRKRT